MCSVALGGGPVSCKTHHDSGRGSLSPSVPVKQCLNQTEPESLSRQVCPAGEFPKCRAESGHILEEVRASRLKGALGSDVVSVHKWGIWA